MRRAIVIRVCGCLVAGLLAARTAPDVLAQPGWVLSHQKISDTQGSFTGELEYEDRFGFAVASLGDLDGDGVGDIAVGAPWDDDGGTDRGAVWVLFLNADGTVNSHQKISNTEGGFTGTLDNGDFFGWGLASLGDLDGNGVADLAVTATGDDDGGTSCGAVWVLFLHADGSVMSHQKISNTQGGFSGTLHDGDFLGGSATSLGDLDGAGASVAALAVGAWASDDGGTNRGAVWVLFLNANGTVNSHQKISDTAGGFTGVLDDFDQFGTGVASLGDLDGDGVADLAVGANQDDDGSTDRGAVWVLFLNSNGTVNWHQKISDTAGGFTGVLDDGDGFGSAGASLGDLDGDGVDDLAVGAGSDDDGGTDRGAVWVLFLNVDGTVHSHQKISDTEGGFSGELHDEDLFYSVAALGDHNGDGVCDLAVGAHLDDDGGTDHGAVWVLFLDGVGLGDLNCDCAVNAFDIDPFVLALTDPNAYATAWPDCDRMLADCNGDGVVNAFDIDPFVELLTGG